MNMIEKDAMDREDRALFWALWQLTKLAALGAAVFGVVRFVKWAWGA